MKLKDFVEEEIKKGRTEFKDIGVTTEMEIDEDSQNKISFNVVKKENLENNF